jgi:hypothetical protein
MDLKKTGAGRTRVFGKMLMQSALLRRTAFEAANGAEQWNFARFRTQARTGRLQRIFSRLSRRSAGAHNFWAMHRHAYCADTGDTVECALGM